MEQGAWRRAGGKVAAGTWFDLMRQHAPARAECIDAWRWVGRALPAPAQARRSTAHARLVPGGTGPPKRPGGAGDGWLQTREPGGVWGSERREYM